MVRNQESRFAFTPPWHVTRCGFIGGALRLQRGCDEWHNKSRYVVVPLVGMFVWFATLDRSGPEHVFAYIGAAAGLGEVGRQGTFYGNTYDGCDLCSEFVNDVVGDLEERSCYVAWGNVATDG